MMPALEARAEVVIVGGGVIGLACAVELAEAGREVVLLERARLGDGASSGNCGLLTPSHSLPLTQPGMVRKAIAWMAREDAPIYVRKRLDLGFLLWGMRFARRCREPAMRAALRGRGALLELSRALYDDFVARHAPDAEYETVGLLEVYATEAGRAAAEPAHALLAEQGVASTPVAPDALLAREPALREGLAGCQWYPRDAHLRPEALLRGLRRRALALGVRIVEGAAADGFECGARGVAGVSAAGRVWRCAQLVLCAGVWSPPLGRALGLRLPIQAGKGYSITTLRPASCPAVPLLLKEANMAVTPWASGLRLGGTIEFAGLDAELRPARLDALRRGAARFLREPLGAEPVEWCGFRPMTPDELPLLGRAPRAPNAIVATGHGMMGVSMAPATARIVRELIGGELPSVDLAPFAPDRY